MQNDIVSAFYNRKQHLYRNYLVKQQNYGFLEMQENPLFVTKYGGERSSRKLITSSWKHCIYAHVSSSHFINQSAKLP